MNNNKLFQDFVANAAGAANGLGNGDISHDELMQSNGIGGQKMIDALGDVVTAIRLVVTDLVYIQRIFVF